MNWLKQSYIINEDQRKILVGSRVTIYRQEPLMDLKDESITIWKKSKDLKSIKEVKKLEMKDFAKKC